MRKSTLKVVTRRMAAGIAVLWLGVVVPAAAAQAGEAIVVARVGGDVRARVPAGSLHDGKSKTVDLPEGSAVGENSRIMTGKDSRACVLLSPGPVLCVAPDTELSIRQLRHTASGLPKTEDDLVRRVHLELHKGRILVHAGVPNASLDIVVSVGAGEVRAGGGTFIVAQSGDKAWTVISEKHDQAILPLKGAEVVVSAGKAMLLTLKTDGAGEVKEDEVLPESPLRGFELCRSYFSDLEGFVLDTGRLDRTGLGRYLGAPEVIQSAVTTDAAVDVSPSVPLFTKIPRPAAAVSAAGRGTGRRWDLPRITAWYDHVGVIKGVNYVPRNAVNSTDMWLEDTFDKDVIDEELGWAQSAGYTTVRVQLQFVVWKNDPKGFLARMDDFLDLARKHGLRVVPVLFDDMNVAGADPAFGLQPEPVPGRHNARWTPSPGAAAVTDRAVWPELEEYVRDVMTEFKRDDRVVFWDLYNRAGDGAQGEASLPLMDQAFNWARDVNPEQPLAVAAWDRFGSTMSTRMLERSDLISFQSFESPEHVEALLLLLRRYERPIICSDWLMRQDGSKFEALLPIFSLNRVGWFNRGLVQGRTQQWIQREDARSKEDAELWQHDVLKSDGTAYLPEEIELIQQFSFQVSN